MTPEKETKRKVKQQIPLERPIPIENHNPNQIPIENQNGIPNQNPIPIDVRVGPPPDDIDVIFLKSFLKFFLVFTMSNQIFCFKKFEKFGNHIRMKLLFFDCNVIATDNSFLQKKYIKTRHFNVEIKIRI